MPSLHKILIKFPVHNWSVVEFQQSSGRHKYFCNTDQNKCRKIDFKIRRFQREDYNFLRYSIVNGREAIERVDATGPEIRGKAPRIVIRNKHNNKIET